MHHLPRFFKITERMDPRRSRRKPKLERRNALKHIEYDAASSSSSLDNSSASSSSLMTQSLNLSDRTSFRIEGNEGEIDRICLSLGLSGPEDFAIPEAAWEARKIRSCSDLRPRSRLNRLDSPESEQLKEKEIQESEEVNELRVRVSDNVNESTESIQCCSMNTTSSSGGGGGGGGGGIKGARPPVIKPPSAMILRPPPTMTLPAIDNACSTWDIFRDFAPENERSSHPLRVSSSSDDDEEEEEEEGEEEEEERDGDVAVGNRRVEDEEESLFVHLSESCSFTTNDDDSSSTTTPMSNNTSPNGRFRRVISPWQKGVLLGRGSFGSVYEGISK